MDFVFKNKRISGILTILPKKTVKFEDEMANYSFSPAKCMKLKLAMGYKEHRIAEPGQCSSDFCKFGLQYMFDNNLIKKEDIDALLFVSQSADYYMPPTSNIIQGHFGLKHDCLCLDINQGCAGFEIGLIQSFMLLEQPAINKVVLMNADVLSPKVSDQDRNSKPLIGDAASITIVEKSNDDTTIYANIKMDGTGAFALNIPAGGFRMPSTAETAIMEQDAVGNFRSKNNLVMQGDDVFNFVQREVPPMIEHLLKQADVDKDWADWYMFHQPNKFMLHKLADKLGVPHEKMPANIVENFGNASGVTVPTCISYNLGDVIVNGSSKLCLAGFGVGLTWSSVLVEMSHLMFNQIVEF
ncbi:MAG: ketoacyl-ACP synthase III [Bacteroidales bacterium]|nr:ketoacyl-ACP synthase III [Bacteroidales bacterium]